MEHQKEFLSRIKNHCFLYENFILFESFNNVKDGPLELVRA